MLDEVEIIGYNNIINKKLEKTKKTKKFGGMNHGNQFRPIRTRTRRSRNY